MRREFFRAVSGFDNSAALGLLGSGKFPQLFQMCRAADRQRYFVSVSSAQLFFNFAGRSVRSSGEQPLGFSIADFRLSERERGTLGSLCILLAQSSPLPEPMKGGART